MLTGLANEYATLGSYAKLMIDMSPFVVAVSFWLLGVSGEKLFNYDRPSKLRILLRTTGLLIASALAFSLFAVFIQTRIIGVGSVSIRRISGTAFVGGVSVYLAIVLWKDDRELVRDLKKIDELEFQLLARVRQKQDEKKP
ncbi:MAG: hypothetical protein JKX70_00645 [Phycisphaerales bacterium]|nr:hypothetical protein [Phycisphaerales bacterium]